MTRACRELAQNTQRRKKTTLENPILFLTFDTQTKIYVDERNGYIFTDIMLKSFCQMYILYNNNNKGSDYASVNFFKFRDNKINEQINKKM